MAASSHFSALIQGTLDLLILKTLANHADHGWVIAKRIQQGSLYPALHRLEQQGWIEAETKPAESGRVAKFYSLTKAGKKQLDHELYQWERLSAAVSHVATHV